MKNMELKEKLVALRKEKGLTQSAVAEKLDVSRQAISRWESGIALPSTDKVLPGNRPAAKGAAGAAGEGSGAQGAN